MHVHTRERERERRDAADHTDACAAPVTPAEISAATHGRMRLFSIIGGGTLLGTATPSDYALNKAIMDRCFTENSLEEDAMACIVSV